MQLISETACRLWLIIPVQSMMLLNSNDINSGKERFRIQVYLQYIKQPNYVIVCFSPDEKHTFHFIQWMSLKYKQLYWYDFLLWQLFDECPVY